MHDPAQPGPARRSVAVLFDSIGRVAWLSAGNALFAVSQWITVVILARCSDASVVGAYALGNALAVPVFALFGLELRTVLSVDSLDRFSIRDYLVLRVFGVGAAFCAATALFLICTRDLQSSMIVFLVFAFRSMDALADLVHGIFQRFERLSVIGRALVLRSTLTLVTLGAIIRWTGNPVAALSGALLASSLAFFFYDVRNVSVFRAELSCRRGKGLRPMLGLAGSALPMAVAVFLTVFNGSIPRLVIEHAQGLASLGVFSVVSYLAFPGGVLMTSMTQASAPGLAEHFRAGRRADFMGLSGQLLGVAATLALVSVLVCLFVGRFLLGLAYGPAYQAYTHLLVVLTFASGLGYVGASLGISVTATGCFWPQLAVHAVLAVVFWVSCVFLIPGFGLLGGAIASGIGNLVGVLAYGALLVRILSVRPEIQDRAAA
jgi:O-antigen/teichoic acid export membrane protein